MKNALFLLLLLAVSFIGRTQKIDPESIAKLPDEQQQLVNSYLQKARNAKTAGIVLCAAGGALIVGGVIAWAAATEDDTWFDEQDPNYSTGNGLIIAGGILGLASIPCFLGIHKNREKARAILYGQKGVSMAPNITLPHTQSFGVQVVIPLGK